MNDASCIGSYSSVLILFAASCIELGLPAFHSIVSTCLIPSCGLPSLPSPLQVTKQQLFESGEGEFFEWSGLVVSKDVWRRKEIRSHTKHVYVQRK